MGSLRTYGKGLDWTTGTDKFGTTITDYPEFPPNGWYLIDHEGVETASPAFREEMDDLRRDFGSDFDIRDVHSALTEMFPDNFSSLSVTVGEQKKAYYLTHRPGLEMEELLECLGEVPYCLETQIETPHGLFHIRFGGGGWFARTLADGLTKGFQTRQEAKGYALSLTGPDKDKFGQTGDTENWWAKVYSCGAVEYHFGSHFLHSDAVSGLHWNILWSIGFSFIEGDPRIYTFDPEMDLEQAKKYSDGGLSILEK